MHALESYISTKANPVSDMFALESMRLIGANIVTAYRDGHDAPAREAMMLGSMYGGLALTAAGTAAVHALAYPLGGMFHITHGVANAMLLPHVMAFNASAVAGRLATVARTLGIADAATGEQAATQALIARPAEWTEVLRIPQDLRRYGVSEADDAGTGRGRLQGHAPDGQQSQADVARRYRGGLPAPAAVNAPAIRARLLIVADDLSGAADCAVAGTRPACAAPCCCTRAPPARPGRTCWRWMPIRAARRRPRPPGASSMPGRHWPAPARACTRKSTRRCAATPPPRSPPRCRWPGWPSSPRPIRPPAAPPAMAASGCTAWRSRRPRCGAMKASRDAPTLARCCAHRLRTALLPLEAIRAGRPALAARFAALQAEGIQAVVCDALGEDDLAHIATASAALQRVFLRLRRPRATLMQALGTDRRAGEGADGGADGGAEDTDGHDADDHDGAGAAAGTDAGIVPAPC